MVFDSNEVGFLLWSRDQVVNTVARPEGLRKLKKNTFVIGESQKIDRQNKQTCQACNCENATQLCLIQV